MKTLHTVDLGPRVESKPFAAWGLTHHQLHRDREMQQVMRGLWARHQVPLTTLQRTVLMQKSLRTERNDLAITGLPALQLLSLPVGRSWSWLDALLRTTPAPRSHEMEGALSTPHFTWSNKLTRTTTPGVRLTKSHGCPRYIGPWGSAVIDPVEALWESVPYIAPWRVTACLDALLSHRILVDRRYPLEQFTRSTVEDRLAFFPPSSRSTVAMRRALDRTQVPTWSPVETLLRLILARLTFPAPEMNHPIRVGGQIFYVDLAWPESRAALEFNGRVHYENRTQYGNEQRRYQMVRDAGWNVRILVWDDIADPYRREQWIAALRKDLGSRGAARPT